MPGFPDKSPCAKCNAVGTVTQHAYAKFLRCAFTLEAPGFMAVLSRRLKCSSCNSTFMGHNPDFIRKLPVHFQIRFPVIFTHKSGVSREIFELLRPLMQHGSGPRAMETTLREIFVRRHAQLHLASLSKTESAIKNPTLQQFSTLMNPDGSAKCAHSRLSELWGGNIPAGSC